MIARALAAVVDRRRAAYAAHPDRQRVLARPVISIGNVSMGGTGKTPLVADVARALVAAGHRPSILSRGYARPRPLEGAVVVSDGDRVIAPFEIAGDEPLMLARQVPGCAVIVAEDRYLAGSFAERRLHCTAHVLDDGFQHLRLARALDIVIVAKRDLTDRVVPLGRLREGPGAIRSADAIVVDREEVIEAAVKDAGARRVFVMTRRVASGGQGPAFAFAGIGRPAAFFESLERAGWVLAGRLAFADHRVYSAADVARIVEAAERAGARTLVTTEKDAVRLERLPSPALPLVVARLEVQVEPADEFTAMLRSAVA